MDFLNPFLKILAVLTSRRFMATVVGYVVTFFGLLYAVAPHIEDLLKTIYTQNNPTEQAVSIAVFVLSAAAIMSKYIGMVDVAFTRVFDEFSKRPPRMADIKATADVITGGVEQAAIDKETVEARIKELEDSLKGIVGVLETVIKKEAH